MLNFHSAHSYSSLPQPTPDFEPSPQPTSETFPQLTPDVEHSPQPTPDAEPSPQPTSNDAHSPQPSPDVAHSPLSLLTMNPPFSLHRTQPLSSTPENGRAEDEICCSTSPLPPPAFKKSQLSGQRDNINVPVQYLSAKGHSM